MRGLSTRAAGGLAAVALLVVGTAEAQKAKKKKPAKPKPGTVQGAKLATAIAPKTGFVDASVAFDGAGGRLLYVNSDAGYLCELRVLDLAQGGAQIATVDLSKITTAPSSVVFAPSGDGFFVVHTVLKDEQELQAAALVSASGKVVRTFGPATAVRLTTHDAEPAVVTYDEQRVRDKKTGKVAIHHTVEVRALETGKRLGSKTTLEADDTGFVKKLDFRIRYWLDDYTRAVGIKGGTWDRKEDQRSPDAEAWYVLPAREFARVLPIKDVVTHAELLALREAHNNEDAFLIVTRDLTRVQLFTDGKLADVTLEQPFHHYDPKSLRYQPRPRGGWYFSLAIDPVNPDAVARKKADLAWLDLYTLDPGQAKARRVARLLLGKRDITWSATDTHWAILEKLKGFTRGAAKLSIYELTK